MLSALCIRTGLPLWDAPPDVLEQVVLLMSKNAEQHGSNDLESRLKAAVS